MGLIIFLVGSILTLLLFVFFMQIVGKVALVAMSQVFVLSATPRRDSLSSHATGNLNVSRREEEKAS